MVLKLLHALFQVLLRLHITLTRDFQSRIGPSEVLLGMKHDETR